MVEGHAPVDLRMEADIIVLATVDTILEGPVAPIGEVAIEILGLVIAMVATSNENRINANGHCLYYRRNISMCDTSSRYNTDVFIRNVSYLWQTQYTMDTYSNSIIS